MPKSKQEMKSKLDIEYLQTATHPNCTHLTEVRIISLCKQTNNVYNWV